MLKAAPAVICIVAVSNFALGQVDETAKALLKESGAAIKAVKGVTFDVLRSSDGMGSLKMGGTATITYLRPSNMPHTPGTPTTAVVGAPSFKVIGQVEIPGDGKLDLNLALVDNKTVTFVDNKNKAVYEKPLSVKSDGEKGASRTRQVMLPTILIEAEPYERELRATNISMDEPKIVGGEPCDVVKVQTDNKSTHLIAIAQKDRLPRMYEIARPAGKDVSLINRWELSNVKINNSLTVADLAIKTPEGYKFSKEEAKPVEAAQPPKVTTPARGLPIGTTAPALNLKLAGGGDLKTTDLAGSVTVLGFWSPIIPASSEMGKALQGLLGKIDQKAVKVYGVACRMGSEDEPTVQKWIGDNKVTFRSAIAGDSTAEAFAVVGFPSVVVLDKAGKVSAYFEAIPTVDALKLATDNAAK